MASFCYISFLLSAPGVVTITFEGVIISAPFAVAAPLNIFSTIALKVSTSSPSVTYSAVSLIWYPSRLCASYAEITLCSYVNESSLVLKYINKFISRYEIYYQSQHSPDFHYMLHNKTYNRNSTPACCPNYNRLSTCFNKLYHIAV